MLLFGHRVVPSLAGLLPILRDAADARRFHHHVSLNASKLVACRRDPQLAAAVAAAHTRAADGSSLQLAARIHQRAVPERIAGCDLAWQLLHDAATRGWPVALVGGRPEVLARVHALATHIGAPVAVAADGYGPLPSDLGDAQIVFAALGSPRAELWLHARRPPALCLGVGGSFDVWAGAVPRAPAALRAFGLEGVARVAREPRKRLWPFLVNAVGFAAELPRA